MNAIESLCRQCGECCAGMPMGPHCKTEDLVRIITKLKVEGPLVKCLDTQRPADKSDMMHPCPCLERSIDGYKCIAYDARPKICRTYACAHIQKMMNYLSDGLTDQQVLMIGTKKLPSRQPHSFSSRHPKTFMARIRQLVTE